ncbi:MAG: M20/M25/M40 family metallo-hydrolase, partial [Lysobacteraceae bacterium]
MQVIPVFTGFRRHGAGKLGRIWALAALAVGFWLLAAYGQHRPVPLGLDAPAGQFSAARADAVMARLLGEQKPRPAGSSQNADLRARLLRELAGLGVKARTQTRMQCGSRGGFVACGTVNNIIADIRAGSGRAVLLMAHLDSVAAGPGAGDDMSGVATILEAIRALKARGLSGNRPIVALFTDGEESGLLGAQAYLRDPLVRAGTGVVINMEARGNRGPSYLFQTSPGDAPLVDLYAQSVSHVAASSLYAEIYRVLPNDTDLTPFLRAGIPGYNFAFIGNVAQYHTPLDRRENLDPASLQHHGDNLLGLADTLSRTGDAALKGGDAIYMDVLGWWLPRLSQGWALPLSVAVFGMIVLAGFLTQRA